MGPKKVKRERRKVCRLGRENEKIWEKVRGFNLPLGRWWREERDSKGIEIRFETPVKKREGEERIGKR